MKRVAAVAGDPVPANLAKRAGCGTVPAGPLLIRSDAPDGLDSRQLGLIDDHDVIDVVSARRVAGAGRGHSGGRGPVRYLDALHERARPEPSVPDARQHDPFTY